MKTLSAALIAAAILTSALPAIADNRDHYDHGRYYRGYLAPAPHYAYVHRYYEGQYWHGHRLTYRGGRWGYFAPRHGATVFIGLPL